MVLTQESHVESTSGTSALDPNRNRFGTSPPYFFGRLAQAQSGGGYWSFRRIQEGLEKDHKKQDVEFSILSKIPKVSLIGKVRMQTAGELYTYQGDLLGSDCSHGFT